MLFKTHVALGFLAALGFTLLIPSPNPILFFAIILFLNAVPDIDTDRSRIGKKFWYISKPLRFIFGHRGFFHSIYPGVILLLAFMTIGLPYLGIACLLGYATHLLTDSITREGINWLHPFSTLRVQGFIEVGTLTETVFFLAVLAVDIIVVLKLLTII